MKFDECIYKVEIIITQLNDEMAIINRPKLMSQVTAWRKEESQMESHRDTRFYSELVHLNQDASYKSDFLSKNLQEDFKELSTLDKRKEFLVQLTGKG